MRVTPSAHTDAPGIRSPGFKCTCLLVATGGLVLKVHEGLLEKLNKKPRKEALQQAAGGRGGVRKAPQLAALLRLVPAKVPTGPAALVPYQPTSASWVGTRFACPSYSAPLGSRAGARSVTALRSISHVPSSWRPHRDVASRPLLLPCKPPRSHSPVDACLNPPPSHNPSDACPPPHTQPQPC